MRKKAAPGATCALCGGALVFATTYCGKSCMMRARQRKVTPLATRLWQRVLLAEGDGCWEWQGAANDFGHGVIGAEGGRGAGNVLTHRASWEIAYGPIPDGMCVLHRCDNPPCVRPDHLFLGTRLDNNRDMVSKGRHASQIGTQNLPVGEQHGMSKVTGAQVLDMRRRFREKLATGVQLADEYGLNVETVYGIVSGKTWKHLNKEEQAA